MTALDAWEHRPTEEANLFNPAFVGSLIYEFIKAYQKSRSEGAPITYVPIALAISNSIDPHAAGFPVGRLRLSTNGFKTMKMY